MAKAQNRKDSQGSLSEKNPSSIKVTQGKSSVANRKNLSAIVSDSLDINPPPPNIPKASQKRESPGLIRIDKAATNRPPWLREFIKERLEMDVPAPVPSEIYSFHISPIPPNPDSSNSRAQNPNSSEVNRLFFNANKDTKPLRLSDLFVSTDIEEAESPGDNFEAKKDGHAHAINQARSDTGFPSSNPIRISKGNSDSKTGESRPSPGSGENGRSKAPLKEVASGLEAPSFSGVDNQLGLPYNGKAEAAVAPQGKSHIKTRWIFTSIVLIALVTMAAWALRVFTYGQHTKTETEETSSQPPIVNLSAAQANDVSSLEMSDSSIALPPAISQNTNSQLLQHDRSVLTQIQKDRLYKASLNYLADDEEEAVYIARSIGYVPNEGHPATMCGPLAMSILRDAMLVDRYADLGDFWLLNPRDKYTVQSILERYFPREHYQWYQTSTPINYYDFKSYPLYSGDFLYLFAGRGGTFEHMLVVTRVDDGGRAYSVLAQEDSKGYSIKEVMLYDPNNPGEGYFYDITDRANAEFGLTGFGGFWMWRRITPIPEVNLDDLAFGDQLDSVLNETGGEWHIYIKEIGGRVIYARNPQEVINPASVIKAPLAVQFFQALDYPEETDLIEYLSEHGVGGRTYMQLLRAMLVYSEEDATDLLQEWVEDRISVEDNFARWWGALKTTYTPRRTTAEEMSKIFEGLYQGSGLLPQERQIILDLMSEYTPEDDTRLGLMKNYLPDGYQLFNKRGSNVQRAVIVADAAILEMEEKAYVVAMFGYPEAGTNSPPYDDLESAIEEAAPLIWSYLSQQ